MDKNTDSASDPNSGFSVLLFAGLQRPARRLLPLSIYCSPNQPKSVFLSQQFSRNSVFQPSFRPANGEFYRSYWDIIKKEFMEMIQDFYKGVLYINSVTTWSC